MKFFFFWGVFSEVYLCFKFWGQIIFCLVTTTFVVWAGTAKRFSLLDSNEGEKKLCSLKFRTNFSGLEKIFSGNFFWGKKLWTLINTTPLELYTLFQHWELGLSISYNLVLNGPTHCPYILLEWDFCPNQPLLAMRRCGEPHSTTDKVATALLL